MKKLSIQEKAKAYDEAIKKVNDFYEGKTKLYSDIDKTLNYLFPELKESEDERIIQWIRKELEDKYVTDNIVNNEMADKALAWLEKQGEQKTAEFDDTNAKRMFIKALERVEEQNAKGYKLTDCDKNSWWEDFKAYTSCTIEQKSVIKMKTP